MAFSQWKQGMMLRKDHSRKGSIDEGIRQLVDLLNSDDRFFTTSSCAGRLMLIERASHRKIDTSWLFVSHELADPAEVWERLQKARKPCSFRMEPFILHACAADLDAARLLLRACHAAGIKRAGIISLEDRILVEIIGTEFLDAPVHDGRKLLVGHEHLDYLVSMGNQKWKRNKNKIELLAGCLQDHLRLDRRRAVTRITSGGDDPSRNN
ncbi:MAG: tRNA wybutosine-synthesizing 3 family protein [Nanoarchaeota archaeon]